MSETADPKAMELAQKIDRTAQAEADSLLGGLSLLPSELRLIILGAIIAKLTAALAEARS